MPFVETAPGRAIILERAYAWPNGQPEPKSTKIRSEPINTTIA
jgi:hypothetical protein